MPITLLILSALLLLVLAFVIFRVLVRRDYRKKGKLGWFATFLEFVIFAAHINSAYLFLPVDWPAIPKLPDNRIQIILGLCLSGAGLVLVLLAMGYLGFKKAFGQKVDGLKQTGLYRRTRNPQLVSYSILIIGLAILWLSWYSIVWVILYFIIAHWMVITEEEHLRDIYGESYGQYCRDVPRYLWKYW
jgi:protein-S-isoprenylcysteine O-methyltransferase Ste14